MKNRLGRRRFVKIAAAGTAAAALAGCRSAEGGPAVETRRRVQWRLVSSFPRGLDTLYGAAETLAERLEAMSGGMFRIRPYPAGECSITMDLNRDTKVDAEDLSLIEQRVGLSCP